MAGVADAGTAWMDVLPRLGAGFRRQLDQGFSDSASHAENAFTGAFKKVALAAGGIFAAVKVGDFLKGTVEGASDLSESISKNQVVFGAMSAEVLKFADNSSTAFGQSKAQALEATGTFGNLLRAVGLTEKDSAKLSTSMVGLASDLASFNNTSVDDALLALRSGLVGETEPLKRFGVNLNETTLKAKAMELGLSNGKGVLDANAKAQAAYAIIMEQTKLAQGDFARTSGGLANQQRILAATVDNLKAKLGAALLPAMTAVTKFGASVFVPMLESVGERVVAFGAGVAKAAAGPVKEIAGGLRAMVSAFKAGDGDITSSGFAGQLERLGAVARRVVDFVVTGVGRLREAFSSFRQLGEWEAHGNFERLGVAVAKVVTGVGRLKEAFTSFRQVGEWEAHGNVERLGVALAKVVGFLQNNGKEVLQTVGVIVAGIIVPAFVSWAAATIAAVAPWVLLAAAVFGAIKLLERFPQITRAVGAAARWVGEQFTALAEWAKSIWPAVQEVISHVVNVVQALWHDWGDDLLRVAKAVWSQITNIVETAVGLVSGVIRLVTAVINGDWGKAWDAVKDILRTAWDFIVETIKNEASAILPLVGQLFNTLVDIVTSLGGKILSWFADLPGAILDALGDLGGLLWDKGRDLLTGLLNGVLSLEGKIFDFYLSLPGRILDALGDVGHWLWDTGINLIQGLIDGIKSMAGRVASAAWDTVKGAVKSAWDAIVPGSPSKIGRAIGRNFAGAIGLGTGEVDLSRDVNRMMSQLPGVGADLGAVSVADVRLAGAHLAPAGGGSIDYRELAIALAAVSIKGEVTLDGRAIGAIDSGLENRRRRYS